MTAKIFGEVKALIMFLIAGSVMACGMRLTEFVLPTVPIEIPPEQRVLVCIANAHGDIGACQALTKLANKVVPSP
jgi:hypothetical protein